MMKNKVLILDDDHDIVEILTLLLEEEGYVTSSLYSGEYIMETITSFKPDRVLMDIMLGNMDGRQICRDIKTYYDEPPIILISASHNVQDSLDLQGAPDDFIAKPFDIFLVLDKVNQFCGR